MKSVLKMTASMLCCGGSLLLAHGMANAQTQTSSRVSAKTATTSPATTPAASPATAESSPATAAPTPSKVVQASAIAPASPPSAGYGANRWSARAARYRSSRAATPGTGVYTAQRRQQGHSIQQIQTEIQLEEGETLVQPGEPMPTPADMPGPAAEQLPPPQQWHDGPGMETPVLEGYHTEGMMHEGGDCCEPGCDSCEHCGDKVCICWDWCWFEDFSIIGGVQGFKGPVDLGRNGNFGFHEGFNWGMPLLKAYGVGFQIGARATQSNLSGDSSEGGPDDLASAPAGDSRNQLFITTGLFHRSVAGWQWGIVGDFLHDDYYVEMDLAQVRGEIGFVGPRRSEFGFMFASGSQDDLGEFIHEDNEFNENWDPTDYYALYHRRQFHGGSQARVWAGVTGQSDAIVGMDIHIPLSQRWALETDATYLIPEQGQGREGSAEESWNIAIGFAWYPGKNGRCCPQEGCWGDVRQYSPLLNVADNSTFLVDRKEEDD